MFRLLGWVAVRFRFLVLSAWIAGAAAATMWLPSIGEAQHSPLGELVAEDAAALETEARAAEHFEFPLLSRTAVVQRNASGLSLV